MAKIAVERSEIKSRGGPEPRAESALNSRVLSEGDGWLVEHIICTAGPLDRSFEEQHSGVAIGIVLSGSFQYRTRPRSCGAGELMTPGSLLLGNPGQYFECGHEHAAGDRCLAFRYAPEYFEQIAADAGAVRQQRAFPLPRVPAVRELSLTIARTTATLTNRKTENSQLDHLSWEEQGIRLAAEAIAVANGLAKPIADVPTSTIARVTRAVRMIENNLSSRLSLRCLAQEAKLSPFHFLRSFEQVTGLTPYQYVRRTRLRAAATRLKTDQARVLDIVLDCGFGDVSNFNHAFQQEFGMSPSRFRTSRAGDLSII